MARSQSRRKERKRSKKKWNSQVERKQKHIFKNTKSLVTLLATGEEIDLEIVDRLSLLHDIFKAVVIKELKADPKFKSNPTEEQIHFWNKMKERYKGMYETGMFCAIFQDDYPEFCSLINNYGNHKQLTSEKAREQQIVHYADWRVFVDEIIPLQERIDDLRIRYASKIEAAGLEGWNKRVLDEFTVESSICTKINILPEDLKERIQ
jgi:hypothetical protein